MQSLQKRHLKIVHTAESEKIIWIFLITRLLVITKLSITKADGTIKNVTTKVTKDNKTVVESFKKYKTGLTRKVYKTVSPSGSIRKSTVYKDKLGKLKKKLAIKVYKKPSGTKVDKRTTIKASGVKIKKAIYTRNDGTKKTVTQKWNTKGQMISSTTVDTAKISK